MLIGHALKNAAVPIVTIIGFGVALLAAAVTLAVGAVVGLRTPMPDTTKLDRTPAAPWPAPQLLFTPDADDGPVLVVYPEGVWYRYRDEGDLDEIVERHLLGGTPVDHLRI